MDEIPAILKRIEADTGKRFTDHMTLRQIEELSEEFHLHPLRWFSGKPLIGGIDDIERRCVEEGCYRLQLAQIDVGSPLQHANDLSG